MCRSNRTFDLLSLGEVLLRLSPTDNERLSGGDVLRRQLGGAELNVAAGVSLLGLKTGIISKLPDNAIGSYAKNRIRFCGVSDDYLVYDDSEDARLGIYYYENGALSRSMISTTPSFHPPAVSTQAGSLSASGSSAAKQEWK